MQSTSRTNIMLQKPLAIPTEPITSGTKLIDMIMACVEDDFMKQLEGHLVSKAYQINNANEVCSKLIHEQVLDHPDIKLVSAHVIPYNLDFIYCRRNTGN